MLRKMGEFMGASKVEFKELGKNEKYIITKLFPDATKTLVLRVSGNQIDGGWMSVEAHD